MWLTLRSQDTKASHEQAMALNTEPGSRIINACWHFTFHWKTVACSYGGRLTAEVWNFNMQIILIYESAHGSVGIVCLFFFFFAGFAVMEYIFYLISDRREIKYLIAALKGKKQKQNNALNESDLSLKKTFMNRRRSELNTNPLNGTFLHAPGS